MPYVPKIPKEKSIEIKRMYEKDGYSIQKLADYFSVAYGSMYRFLRKNKTNIRSKKEAFAISETYGKELIKWRQKHKSWNKGLTITDPRVRNNIEKSRLTQIKNGKNKGINNPMYGKLPKFKSGFRKDLGHFVRSSWEANFCRIIKALGLNYEYETYTFTLDDGRTYTPDFYIKQQDKFYEIKGHKWNDKFEVFKKEYTQHTLIIIDEKIYNKLIRKFGHLILIEDRDSFYTKKELATMFNDWKIKSKEKSLRKFCNEYNISYKLMYRIFGSVNNI